jgi:type I restriction enzyme, S subunit
LKIKRWGSIADDNPSFIRVFKKGHILFGKRRPYLKKAAIAEFDGICSGDIIVMEPQGDLMLPELLPFIVQSEKFWDWAIKPSSGSLSPKTKFQLLADCVFDIPILEEQIELLKLSLKLAELSQINDEAIEYGNFLLEKLYSEVFSQNKSKWKEGVLGCKRASNSFHS